MVRLSFQIVRLVPEIHFGVRQPAFLEMGVIGHCIMVFMLMFRRLIAREIRFVLVIEILLSVVPVTSVASGLDVLRCHNLFLSKVLHVGHGRVILLEGDLTTFREANTG